MSNSEVLAAALDDLPGRLVVYLAEVDYLDSADLSVFAPDARPREPEPRTASNGDTGPTQKSPSR